MQLSNSSVNYFRRPREGGDPAWTIDRGWVPAFAGMTERIVMLKIEDCLF